MAMSPSQLFGACVSCEEKEGSTACYDEINAIVRESEEEEEHAPNGQLCGIVRRSNQDNPCHNQGSQEEQDEKEKYQKEQQQDNDQQQAAREGARCRAETHSTTSDRGQMSIGPMGSSMSHSSSKRSSSTVSPKTSYTMRMLSGRSSTSVRNTRSGKLAKDIQSGMTIGLDSKVVDLLSFSIAQVHVLRGSPLRNVLHKFAAIFENAKGSALTYELSQRIKRIHSFISHNWSVPRWQKFFCLTYHFNRLPALMITIVYMCILVVLGLSGVYPFWSFLDFSAVGIPYVGPITNLAQYTVPPLFFALLFFMHEGRHLVGRDSVPVFLDKTCIHQTDRAIQRQGIEKLGAFLAMSENIVVCYTDVYLQKLWTIFEVASFLALHPVKRMHVIPVELPFILIFPLVFLPPLLLFFNAVPKASDDTAHQIDALTILRFTGVISFIFRLPFYLLGVWQQSLWAKLQHRIRGFDIRGCICFCEDDRPFVYENVAMLMRSVGEVEMGAGDEEALDAFNRLVQERIGKAMYDSVTGFFGVPLDFLLIFGIVVNVPILVDLVALIQRGWPLSVFFNLVLRFFQLSFVGLPLDLLMFSSVGKKCPKGTCEKLGHCFFFVYIPAFFLDIIMAFFDGTSIFPNSVDIRSSCLLELREVVKKLLVYAPFVLCAWLLDPRVHRLCAQLKESLFSQIMRTRSNQQSSSVDPAPATEGTGVDSSVSGRAETSITKPNTEDSAATNTDSTTKMHTHSYVFDDLHDTVTIKVI